MTTIKIFKKNEKIVGFECSGHTGYAEQGSDIVCAAVSSLTQSTCLGIIKVLKLKCNYENNAKKALLKIILAKSLSPEEVDSAQVLFETLIMSIQDLMQEYKNFIKLEAQDEIY